MAPTISVCDAEAVATDESVSSHGVDEPSGLDAAAGTFTQCRPRLFGIAYRMLGSVAEAEDVVQDAWVRWQQSDWTSVRNPAGFLTTITTRLAINTAESARVRREQYIGPWLPEPVDTSADPALGAEKAEALESAVLVLLETLRPEQRAAFVLREAFDYSYNDIAQVLETSPDNARQLVSRARKHVHSERQQPVNAARHRDLLAAFVAAAQAGDLERLEEVLSVDVVSLSDGAGVAPRAARRPVVGRDHVARLVAGFAPDWWDGASISWVETNGQPSVLIERGSEALAVLSVSVSAAGIDQLMWVMAPDKLMHVP